MDALDDDVLMTSKQLAELLNAANADVNDISTSAMYQLNLGMETLAKLNKAENRKVASVGDVMNAFSSVVVSYIGETRAAMNRVMSDLGLIDKVNKKKLSELNVRTNDEVTWITTGVNSTRDSFQMNVQQERVVQDGLMKAVEGASNRLAKIRNNDRIDMDAIADKVAELKRGIKEQGEREIAKVRKWIASRSPKIAKGLLGSLLQKSPKFHKSNKSMY